MTIKVLTVAFTDGAHAEAIGRAAAKRLDFRYVNDEVLDLAAAAAGVGTREVASVEQSESLIARIVRSLGNIPSPELGITANAMLSDTAPEYRAMIQEVVRRLADEGNVVIGAHGAGVSLAGTPGLLRVFITAPMETRIARVASERNVDEKSARHEVEHTDRERKAYFDRFFRVREEPALYDLVVNTGVLSEERAVAAILGAAG